MSWDRLIDLEFSGRLCLTLFHSVWQVAAVAAAAWAVDRAWGRRSVEKSYALYVTALLVSLAAMPITYAVVEVAAPPAVADGRGAVEAVAPVPTSVATAPDEPSPAVAEVGEMTNTGGPAPAHDTARSLPVAAVAKEPSTLWLRVAPWIAAFYAVGVLFMLARLIACIWRAQRLGSGAQRIADGVLVDQLNALARTWSMRVVPALARAERIAVPKVVGLVRPTILLPTAAITGLAPDELEMILAHELAHVRRYDMWVNLLQRFAEVALFFNPALWCLSRRISVLREYCCDELTCRATSDSGAEPRMRYASALLRVVELSRNALGNQMGSRVLEGSDVAALAANGRSPSELRRRVARLFGEPLREPVRLPRGGVLALAVVAVLLVMGPSVWQSAADFTAARPADVVEDGAETGNGDVPTVPAEENTDGEAKEEYSVPITVFGRALDVRGEPIEGAEIFLAAREPGHKRLAQTMSAADGSYRFRDVSLPIKRPDTNAGKNRGSFEVFGIAEGYALAWRPKKAFYPDRKVVLDTWGDPNRDQPPGYGAEDPVELDLTFGPPKTIRGRIVDELGHPIPDTTLAIRSCSRLLDRDDGLGGR